jgi:hypothetical protein
MERPVLSGLSLSNAPLGSQPHFGRLVLNAQAGHQPLSNPQLLAATKFSDAVQQEVASTPAIAKLIEQADQAGVDVVCKSGPNPFNGLPNTPENNDLYVSLGLYQKGKRTPAPQDGKISVGQALKDSQFPSTPNALAQGLLNTLKPMLEKAAQGRN